MMMMMMMRYLNAKRFTLFVWKNVMLHVLNDGLIITHLNGRTTPKAYFKKC